jgi:predicted Fe-S protein YdhL (DUF1289 family)
MDFKTGLCMGCGRTLEEIGKWSVYSTEERNKILKELPFRKEMAS